MAAEAAQQQVFGPSIASNVRFFKMSIKTSSALSFTKPNLKLKLVSSLESDDAKNKSQPTATNPIKKKPKKEPFKLPDCLPEPARSIATAASYIGSFFGPFLAAMTALGIAENKALLRRCFKGMTCFFIVICAYGAYRSFSGEDD